MHMEQLYHPLTNLQTLSGDNHDPSIAFAAAMLLKGYIYMFMWNKNTPLKHKRLLNRKDQ